MVLGSWDEKGEREGVELERERDFVSTTLERETGQFE